MGELIRWLVHEDQKALFNFLFALVMNILFLAMIALLLWPLGKLMLAFRLAKGYGSLWIVIAVTAGLVNRIQHVFRVDLYEHFNEYVISNLAVSGLFQVGWSAFAVLTLHDVVTSVPIWITISLYLVGVLSCFITFLVVSAFYQGEIYRFFNLPLALASFLIFSLWPASARVLYGWFLQLF